MGEPTAVPSIMAANNNHTNNNTVTIDVVSDNVCPFCFVGKRSMEQALREVQAEHPDTHFDVRWRPFFLNADSPVEGRNKREAYVAKFGEERVKQMEPYMVQVGRQAGIEFSYGGNTGNTLRSHRLVEWAFAQGGAAAQDRVVEAMFQGYFEKEQDITSIQFLVAVAHTAGLDARAAEEYLRSDEGVMEVLEEEHVWRRQHRITGVPFFVIDGSVTLSGAQQPAVFADALERAAADKTAAGASSVSGSGVVCGPEGCAVLS